MQDIYDVIMKAQHLYDKYNLESKKDKSLYDKQYFKGFYKNKSNVIDKGIALENALASSVKISLSSGYSSELCDLALELYKLKGEKNIDNPYFEAAVVAKVMSEEDCSEWLMKQIKPNMLKPFVRIEKLAEALRGIMHNSNGWFIRKVNFDILDNKVLIETPIHQKLEDGLVDVLIKCKNELTDNILYNIIDTSNEVLCSKLEEYFYKMALTHSSNYLYIRALKECSCDKCDKLLVKYLENTQKKKDYTNTRWYAYENIRWYCATLPGSKENRIKEVLAAWELIKAGKIFVLYGTPAENAHNLKLIKSGKFKPDNEYIQELEPLYMQIVEDIKSGKI